MFLGHSVVVGTSSVFSFSWLHASCVPYVSTTISASVTEAQLVHAHSRRRVSIYLRGYRRHADDVCCETTVHVDIPAVLDSMWELFTMGG